MPMAAPSFKVESVWQKARTEFPDALHQVATKIAVEDAQAQWTMHNNLNQWFYNMLEKDLVITTGW